MSTILSLLGESRRTPAALRISRCLRATARVREIQQPVITGPKKVKVRTKRNVCRVQGFAVFCLLLFVGFPVYAATIKIASYNVDNLFDARADGTEYPDYDPDGPCGWDRHMADLKAAHIARVLTALNADIVGLQEIESRRALDLLLRKLKENDTPYPYAALAEQSQTTVKCAVISRFPLSERREWIPAEHDRSILQVTVTCEGFPLILFVNHWKSKQGPESRRMVYARALKAAVDRLPADADYILIGDFNADYNEYVTFRQNLRLNDTNGLTGINHVLGTVAEGRMVTENMLTGPHTGRRLYNLWLELPPQRRWSYNFFGHKNSPDSIILSRGLYDDKGITYIDNSFDRFDPPFLFDRRGAIFRWQQADRGRGRHLGRGYSDHLPVFAFFSTDSFRPATGADRP